MKYGYAIKKNGILYAPGMEVPGDAPIKVELTNDVPEGALDTNADGSVNTYDAEGNVTGTISAERVQQVLEEADMAFEEQEKLKRGRKPKEV